MANDYFDSGDYTALVKDTLARAESANAIFAAIVAAFDKLPPELALQQNRVTYVTAAGTDDYTVTLSPAPAAYVEGMSLRIKFGNSNTGPVTINVNDLGAVTALKSDATAFAENEITAAQIADFVYDGQYFRRMSFAHSFGVE